MSLVGRSLVSLSDLGLAEVVTILDCAEQMAKEIGFDNPATRRAAVPLDRILATCFFEPSTRTRLSFASAMLRLGGQVVDFGGVQVSSVSKGETMADTMRMVSGYSDIIVQRHPLAGSAQAAARYATVPVINGGDGPHQHPTQTLTDLFWLRRQKGTLAGLKIGLCGDLKYGRTTHSLAPILCALGSQVVCVAPPELQMPPEHLAQCQAAGGAEPTLVSDLAEALRDLDLDMLYMTRIQRERFSDEAEYERLRGCYVLTPELMKLAPEGMIVMHPLPRVDEISPEVDADPRAQYFRQAAGGVPVRMALIALILGIVNESEWPGRYALDAQPCPSGPGAMVLPAGEPASREVVTTERRCANPKCITSTEGYLPAEFYHETGKGLRCVYCEEPVAES